MKDDKYIPIVAKYDTHCMHSGKLVVRGEKCLWNPYTGDIVSVQSSRFAVMAHEMNWAKGFITDLKNYNKKVYENMKNGWQLFLHGQLVKEGTEFDCLAYYQNKEVHSWTNYHKQLGYELKRKG